MDKVMKILVILFFIVIALLLYILYGFKSEGAKCIFNPLVYGVNQYSDDAGQEMTCTCSLNVPNSPTIFVNKDKAEVIKEKWDGTTIIPTKDFNQSSMRDSFQQAG